MIGDVDVHVGPADAPGRDDMPATIPLSNFQSGNYNPSFYGQISEQQI
jgi:hypothetical protein